jgi:hypothetical protein
MISEQLKNKIADYLLVRIKDEIDFDDNFHIDFEIKEDGSVFEFVSTFYAEQGDRMMFDYDQPQEYERPNIVMVMCNLAEIDEEGWVHMHTDDAEQIVQQTINAYR